MKTILKVIRFAFAILISINAMQATAFAEKSPFQRDEGMQGSSAKNR